VGKPALDLCLKWTREDNVRSFMAGKKMSDRQRTIRLSIKIKIEGNIICIEIFHVWRTLRYAA
jgi:hypothetical protein